MEENKFDYESFKRETVEGLHTGKGGSVQKKSSCCCLIFPEFCLLLEGKSTIYWTVGLT